MRACHAAIEHTKRRIAAAEAAKNEVILVAMTQSCWICGKPKGQPPNCPGHYADTTTDPSAT